MKTIATLFIIVLFSSSIGAQELLPNELIAEETPTCPKDYEVRKKNWIAKNNSNELKNTTWRGSIGQNQSDFLLSYVQPPSADFMSRFGTFVDFGENTFHTRYVAQCGNDCFTSVSGSYKLLGNNQVEFFIEKIGRRGTCAQQDEIIKETIGIFEMAKTDKGMMFRKVS